MDNAALAKVNVMRNVNIDTRTTIMLPHINSLGLGSFEDFIYR